MAGSGESFFGALDEGAGEAVEGFVGLELEDVAGSAGPQGFEGGLEERQGVGVAVYLVHERGEKRRFHGDVASAGGARDGLGPFARLHAAHQDGGRLQHLDEFGTVVLQGGHEVAAHGEQCLDRALVGASGDGEEEVDQALVLPGVPRFGEVEGLLELVDDEEEGPFVFCVVGRGVVEDEGRFFGELFGQFFRLVGDREDVGAGQHRGGDGAGEVVDRCLARVSAGDAPERGIEAGDDAGIDQGGFAGARCASQQGEAVLAQSRPEGVSEVNAAEEVGGVLELEGGEAAIGRRGGNTRILLCGWRVARLRALGPGPYVLRDLGQSVIQFALPIPEAQRPGIWPVARVGLNLCPVAVGPVAGFDQDREDVGVPCLVACKGALDFHCLDVARGEERRADEKDGEVVGVELAAQAFVPFVADVDHLVFEEIDDAAGAKGTERGQELGFPAAVGLVRVGVGDEELRSRWLAVVHVAHSTAWRFTRQAS
jgi:hypothetical protein